MVYILIILKFMRSSTKYILIIPWPIIINSITNLDFIEVGRYIIMILFFEKIVNNIYLNSTE